MEYWPVDVWVDPKISLKVDNTSNMEFLAVLWRIISLSVRQKLLSCNGVKDDLVIIFCSSGENFPGM